MLSNQRNSEYALTLICGMGPVGLAAAYFSGTRNYISPHRVLIIDKRSPNEVALRPQVVLINKGAINVLLSMIARHEPLNDEDIKFLNMLLGTSKIKISYVQRYIINRIYFLNQNEIRKGGAPLVDFAYETTLTTVDLHTGTAVMVSQESQKENTITYRELIGADGANSETLALVNEGLEREDHKDKTIHKKTARKMKHVESTYHLGVYMRIKRKDGEKLALPEKELAVSFLKSTEKGFFSRSNYLYFLRFDRQSYDKSEGKEVKVGFIGEISKELYERYQEIKKHEKKLKELLKKQDKSNEDEIVATSETIDFLKEAASSLVMNYAKTAVLAYLHQHGIKVEEDEIDIDIKKSKTSLKKDELKITAFQGKAQHAENETITINDHTFYLIGDAYFSPQYQIGHGLNNGLELSYLMRLLPVLQERKPDLESYRGNLDSFVKEYNKVAKNNAGNAISNMQELYWIEWYKYFNLKQSDIALKAIESRADEEGKNNYSEIDLNFNAKEAIKSYIFKIINLESIKHILNNRKIDDSEMNENIIEMINQWNYFLNKNASLAKIFSFEIYDKLIRINSLVEYSLRTSKTTYNKLKKLCKRCVILMASLDINKKGREGATPLSLAATFGTNSLIKAVLEQGKYTEKDSVANLYRYVATRDPVIASLFIQHGINPFETNNRYPINLINDIRFDYTPFSEALSSYAFLRKTVGIQFLFELYKKNEPIYSQALRGLTMDLIEALVEDIKKIKPEDIDEIMPQNEEYLRYFFNEINYPDNDQYSNEEKIKIIKEFAISTLSELHLALSKSMNKSPSRTNNLDYTTSRSTLFSTDTEKERTGSSNDPVRNAHKKGV